MTDTTTQYDDLFDNDADDATPQGEQPEGPKALRDAYKKLKAEKEKAEEELNKLRTAAKQSEVEQALSAAGLPKEAAKFAAGAEDINAWIEENRGLFAGAGTPQVQPESTPTPPVVSAEDVEALKGVQSVQPGEFVPGSQDEIQAKLDAAQSPEEFKQTLKELGLLIGHG